jgi:hypothetical protein
MIGLFLLAHKERILASCKGSQLPTITDHHPGVNVDLRAEKAGACLLLEQERWQHHQHDASYASTSQGGCIGVVN